VHITLSVPLWVKNIPPFQRASRVTFAAMYTLLVSIIIGLFLAMLFVNVYFRAKVMKTYGFLVRNRVQFGAEHVFSRQKLEAEILPRYPQFRNEIETFIRHIRYTIKMATVLIALITAFGAVLMYFK
jgi:hypothetical protein